MRSIETLAVALTVVTLAEPAAAQQTSPCGHRCENDGDCPAETFCMSHEGISSAATVFTHAPAGGYCTTDICAEATSKTQVCLPWPQPPGAVGNFTVPPVPLCMAPCKLGSSETPKCHGRLDLACTKVEVSKGARRFPAHDAVCMPRCSNDDECAPGFYCDQRYGTCTDTKPVGAAVGAPCDLDEPGTCLGACVASDLPEPASSGVCTVGCVLGTAGIKETCGGPDADCLLAAPGVEKSANGDLGACVQLCDSASDCSLEGFACDRIADPALRNTLGREGFCVTPTFAKDPIDGGNVGGFDAGAPPPEHGSLLPSGGCSCGTPHPSREGGPLLLVVVGGMLIRRRGRRRKRRTTQ